MATKPMAQSLLLSPVYRTLGSDYMSVISDRPIEGYMNHNGQTTDGMIHNKDDGVVRFKSNNKLWTDNELRSFLLYGVLCLYRP